MIIELANERKLIEPFYPEHLSGASYDVAVGETLISLNRQRRFKIDSGPYAIESGECVTLESSEKFNMLESLCKGILVNKHSVLAKGLFHPTTSIDPGFRGPLALTFFNLGRESFEIEAGMRIAKLIFLPLSEVPQRLYGSTQQPSYRQGSTEIALIVERARPSGREQHLREMYGRPVEYLYERIEALESTRELGELRRESERRRGRRRLAWELLLALFSGAGGALLATHWDSIAQWVEHMW